MTHDSVDSVSIDMRGQKQGPFQIGRHVQPGPRWVWYDGDRFLWWTASRWRWLCRNRFYRVMRRFPHDA